MQLSQAITAYAYFITSIWSTCWLCSTCSMPCNIQECLWQYIVLWDLTAWNNPFPFNRLHKPVVFAWRPCYILFVSIIKDKKKSKIFLLTFLILCWHCITMWKQNWSRETAMWKETCIPFSIQTCSLHLLTTNSRYLSEPCKNHRKRESSSWSSAAS